MFVLIHGVESLNNLRQLPGEARQTYQTFQSWYYDDAEWTGTWSSREEGNIEDLHQAPEALKLSAVTVQGNVQGEIFNGKACELAPMLQPVMFEGEIQGGQLLGRAFAFVGGERRYMYSFLAERSKTEPVITVTPIKDPSSLLPASARLARAIEAEPADGFSPAVERSVHPDLQCAESPLEYLQRLRREREAQESKQRGGTVSGVGDGSEVR